MFYNLFSIFLSFYPLVKFQIPLLYCRIFLYSLENEINVGWKVSQRGVFLFFDRNSLAFPVSYSLFPFLLFFFSRIQETFLAFWITEMHSKLRVLAGTEKRSHEKRSTFENELCSSLASRSSNICLVIWVARCTMFFRIRYFRRLSPSINVLN